MEQVVWKFPVKAVSTFELELPRNANVLCVQMQRQDAQLWVQCDPTAPKYPRKFYVRATGEVWEGDPSDSRYIGTFQPTNGLVFHLYEDIT